MAEPLRQPWPAGLSSATDNCIQQLHVAPAGTLPAWNLPATTVGIKPGNDALCGQACRQLLWARMCWPAVP